MSPSDHFMAANVVFVVTFQFLLYFLAHVATKNHALALFYGALNSISYLGCFFVLRKPILLFCIVALISFLLCNTKKLHNGYVAHYCSDVYKY